MNENNATADKTDETADVTECTVYMFRAVTL